jgi:hypothetical protein
MFEENLLTVPDVISRVNKGTGRIDHACRNWWCVLVRLERKQDQDRKTHHECEGNGSAPPRGQRFQFGVRCIGHGNFPKKLTSGVKSHSLSPTLETTPREYQERVARKVRQGDAQLANSVITKHL